MLNSSIEKTINFENFTHFDAIYQYANEAIVIANSKGIIVGINPSAERLFEWNVNDIVNKELEVLIPKRYAIDHNKNTQKYVKNPRPRSMGKGLDLWAKKKDGTEFPVEISLSPFDIENEKHIIAFIIDISERKKAQDNEREYRSKLEEEVENRTLILKEAIAKLEKTKATLDLSLQRERELNVLKTKFVSIASHEFRTPLSTILSSLSLVEKYIELNQDEKRVKHIERIKKSIVSLTDILNDILTVNKIEEGKIYPNPEQLEIYKFLNDMTLEVSTILKEGQKIEFNSKVNSKIEVFQDKKLLRHIVLNLLSNAIKFSNSNTVINQTLEIKEENIIIKIEDQGIGIPESAKGHLFERFYRAENAGQIQGTGLGLSIVEQYVKILSGTVSFVSKENNGTVFTIVIPKNHPGNY